MKLATFRLDLDAVLDVEKKGATPPDRAAKRHASAATEAAGGRARKISRTVKPDENGNDLDLGLEEPVDVDDPSDPDYCPEIKEEPSAAEVDPSLASFVGNLDRGKVSSRTGFRTAAAFAASIGGANGVPVSRTTLQRRRQQNRDATCHNIRENFKPEEPLTVHWDGIKVPPLVGKGLVERLPVHVTGENVDQLLGASVIPNGTGLAQAVEVTNKLCDWHIEMRVCSMCADTTSSNSGVCKGAIVFIQKRLGKCLLWLACRHHVLEIIPKNLFEKLVEGSSNPDLGSLCARFAAEWESMDQKDFTPGIKDSAVTKVLDTETIQRILSFAFHALESPQIRADYAFFLEVVIMFLGGTPPRGKLFCKPLALSSARFMRRIIYCLSMFMFGRSGQFEVPLGVLCRLRDLCTFFVKVYIEPWFCATDAASAPRHDLQLLQRMLAYRSVSKEISDVACKYFKNHLWYLSEENVSLAFFDSKLSLDLKKKMVERLQASPRTKCRKRFTLRKGTKLRSLQNVTLDYFVTRNSMPFFDCMEIETSFLQAEPEQWSEMESFQKGLARVKALHVVNDVAERDVALVKEFNCGMVRQEDKFQQLLLVAKKQREGEGDLKVSNYFK